MEQLRSLDLHRRLRLAITATIVIVVVLSGGCNRNPYFASVPNTATSPFGVGTGAVGPGNATPSLDLERRLQVLDENNRNLTTQLAQSQQQAQLYRDRSELLQRQLQDVAGQLDKAKLAQKNAAPAQSNSVSANVASKGSARLVANHSLGRRADVFRELGLDVAVEADVIRVSIPADALFQPESSQLSGNAAAVLDRLAAAIQQNFPRQRIAIEGHSDDRPFYGGTYTTAHQLTSAQSMAVLDQLVRRNGLPSNQLFSLAHGSNHPRSDNQSPVGRALNRRIDVVVYPDTF